MLVRAMVVFGFAVLFAARTQAAIPVPFQVSYDVYFNGLPAGKLERRLEISNGRYHFHSETQATGLVGLFMNDRIVEDSEGLITAELIRPRTYRYQQTGGKKNRLSNIRFRWQQGQAEGQENGHAWRLPTTSGMHDKLSYQLMIGRDLANKKDKLAYPVLDNAEVKNYDFNFLGEDTVKTDLGTLKTVKFQRRTPDNKRITTIWCAPSLNYQAVRVDQEKSGSTISAIIRQGR